MIRLTRLNGESFMLNPDLIERVENHPDTVVHLVGDTKYVVSDPVDDVVSEISEYRAGILAMAHSMEMGTYRREREAPRAVRSAGSSVVPFPTPKGD